MALGAADEASAALAAGTLTHSVRVGAAAHVSRQPRADLVDSLRHAARPVRRHGWLDALADVLARISDDRVPVLERARLSAVFALHLDAFFMIHVPGRRVVRSGSAGFAHRVRPAEVLHEFAAEHDRLLHEDVLPALAAEGVGFPGWGDLNAPEQKQCRQLFEDVLHPLLTPLVVDATHPFPQVSALTVNLGVLLRDRHSGVQRFACVQVPTGLPGYLRLDARRLVCIDAIVGSSLGELFQGMQVLERTSFRVTRTERFGTGPESIGAPGMLLRGRRLGLPVRLEVEQTTSARMLDFLVRNLGLAAENVYRVRAPLGMAAAMSAVTGDPGPAPSRTRDLVSSGPGTSPMAALSRLSVTSVRTFLEAATSDPTAVVIAQTLSQRGAGSSEIDALIAAASAGKQVLVILESPTRDRECDPRRLGPRLTSAGCQVVYGPARIHRACALGLVLCAAGDSGARRYSHMCAPGHYRCSVEDPSPLGLMSADQEVCSDLARRLLRLAGSERPARGRLRDEGVAVHLLRMSSRIAER